MAAVAGLPLWAGLLLAAGVFFGVPLCAVSVMERFSSQWADRIRDWHMAFTCLAFSVLLLATLVGYIALVWRWVAA